MGRALWLEYAKYGSLGGSWVVPGIVPLQDPPRYTTPGTPLPHPLVTMSAATAPARCYGGVNMAVGLRSVAQLTLGVHFSRFEGITEVYNLLRIRRINNHLHIPGNK